MSKKVVFTYAFQNKKAGNADGKIIFDGGFSGDATVSLCWARRDGDSYACLPDYTPLISTSADILARGVMIDKSLLIPEGAIALLANCDGEEYAFDIPAEKLATATEKPLYTVAFGGDLHLGGWGSEKCAKEGLVKAREEINNLADAFVTAGDLVQWHGAYSEYEFKKYNWDGARFADNGEKSEEYFGQGLSQWQVAEDYLDGFRVPVYHCQGNHDIRDTEVWSSVYGETDHFGAFLEKWIEKSENNKKYENKIDRDKSVHYYDAEIFGDRFIFTEAPRPTLPHDRFGDDQLYWLDRCLFDGERSGKPIFVLGHCPLTNDLNDANRCLPFEDIDRMLEILKKHPTAIYISGHSHYTLDSLHKNAVNGGQEKPSFFHVGGMAITVRMENGKKVSLGSTQTVICEVYRDRAVLRGRDHSLGKWVSLGRAELGFKKPCLAGMISIERDQSTSAASFFAHAENTHGVRFEWYLDGKLAGEGERFTAPDSFDGYIALRAIDADGGFCSVVDDVVEPKK